MSKDQEPSSIIKKQKLNDSDTETKTDINIDTKMAHEILPVYEAHSDDLFSAYKVRGAYCCWYYIVVLSGV